MKWCCTVFQGWFEQAGKRGLGVFVSTQGNSEPAFILQFVHWIPASQCRAQTPRCAPCRM
jgi:hypothetical protein